MLVSVMDLNGSGAGAIIALIEVVVIMVFIWGRQLREWIQNHF